jgi:hypothetical protein
MSTDASPTDPAASAANPPTPPPALSPPFAVGGPNLPIELAAETVEFSEDGTSARADARISLDWQPVPAIRLRAQGIPFRQPASLKGLRGVFEGPGPLDLRLADGTLVPSQNLSFEQLSTTNEGFLDLGGRLRGRIVRPGPGSAHAVDFLLPNFMDVHGAAVAFERD